MKKTKVLLVSFIMLMMMFSLSGCKFIDVQNEEKEVREGVINYLNEKYSSESSFKKYERKDLKKALDYSSGIDDFIANECCSAEPFCNFPYCASSTFKMKDGTIVMKEKYGGFSDNRQADKIKEDFRQYFYDKFLGRYTYTDEKITYFSKYQKTDGYKTKYNNDGQFSIYYDGTNLDEVIDGERLYIEGDVRIWIQPTNFESTCQEIEKSMTDYFRMYYTGTVYIYDINMKNNNVSDDDKKIGTLEINVKKNEYKRNYRDVYKY